jgi:hypothetical protein
MSKLSILRDDIDETVERASSTLEMLYKFLQNKDELNELVLRGSSRILEDTLEKLELTRAKFHHYVKEEDNNEHNNITN